MSSYPINTKMCNSLIPVSDMVLVDEFGRTVPCRNTRYDYPACGCVQLERCKRHAQDHLTLSCTCPDPKSTFSVIVCNGKCIKCQQKDLISASDELMAKLQAVQANINEITYNALRKRTRVATLPRSEAKESRSRFLCLQTRKIVDLRGKISKVTEKMKKSQEVRDATPLKHSLFGITGRDSIGFMEVANDGKHEFMWFTGEQDDAFWKWDQNMEVGADTSIRK